MRPRTLILVHLMAIAASFGVVSQGMPTSDWEPGMYWTYHTDVLESHDGVRTEGSLTLLVLKEDSSYGLHRWHLAVVTEWYDGTEIMATATHGGLLTPFPWRRWPLITNYLPPKHLPDFDSYFRNTVGSMGLPWLGGAPSMQVDIHQSEVWTESIALTEMPRGTQGVPECIGGDAIAIQYEWTSSYLSTEVDRDEGTAWWSPELDWWVHAEGQGPEGAYEICLSSSGVLSNEDMILRLANALSSTAAIDPEYADGLRGVLERIGVDVPTE